MPKDRFAAGTMRRRSLREEKKDQAFVRKVNRAISAQEARTKRATYRPKQSVEDFLEAGGQVETIPIDTRGGEFKLRRNRPYKGF